MTCTPVVSIATAQGRSVVVIIIIDAAFNGCIPDLVDGQVADAVRLDVFERGPVPVRAGAQRQIDFVDHDGFHLFDAQLGDSCGPKETSRKCTRYTYKAVIMETLT